jgi:hypothetical protein
MHTPVVVLTISIAETAGDVTDGEEPALSG